MAEVKPVDVIITSSDISVNLPKIQINKVSDVVQWKATSANVTFDIVLPAGETTLSSGWQGNKWVVTSGVFQNDTVDTRTVKYDITSGTLRLDPDVEVFP